MSSAISSEAAGARVATTLRTMAPKAKKTQTMAVAMTAPRTADDPETRAARSTAARPTVAVASTVPRTTEPTVVVL